MAKGGGGFFILIVIAFFIVVAGDNMLFGSQGYCMPNDMDCQTETAEETVKAGNGSTNSLCEYPINYYYFTEIQDAEASAGEWGIEGVHTHDEIVFKWTPLWSEDEGRTYKQITNAHMPGSSMYAFTAHYEELCP